MSKLSLYKLPLTISIGIIIFRLCIVLGVNIYRRGDDALVHLITIEYFASYLIYAIPLLLWTFFIATIAMARMQIHLINAKNIILCLIIALIISGLLYFSMQYFYQFIYNILSSDEFMSHNSSLLVMTILQILQGLAYYALTAILILGSIFCCHNIFDKDLTHHLGKVSANTHLLLLLTLTLAVYLFFAQKTIYLYYSFYSMIEPAMMMLSQLISAAIFGLILYFVIRNNFNQSFAKLQTGRIIKASVLSLIFTLFIQILAIVIICLLALFSYNSRTNSNIIMPIVLIITIVAAVLSFVIYRVVTKQYFYNSANIVDNEKRDSL